MRSCVKAALVAGSLLLAGGALAQEPEAAAPAGESAPDKPAKPKPRPKPKPKPKPVPKTENKSSESTPLETGTSELRSGREEPHSTAASEPPPTSPSQGAFAAPPVACDPGQSVLYDGPKGFSLWVTRAGSVTIENPLRPLTPDVTRVLQLVIGDKLATAYGRDLTALRRGASPAALESLLGGPIRWDARLGSLPDNLDIVSDSGAALAELHFKECGTAPAAKAPPAPVARKDGKKDAKPRQPKKAATDQVDSPPPASLSRSASPGSPSPSPAVPQRRFNLPQGAISE